MIGTLCINHNVTPNINTIQLYIIDQLSMTNFVSVFP